MASPLPTSYVYGPGGLPTHQVGPTGQVAFFHHDQLGSTRALTDAAGAVVATASYDAYGKPTATTGSVTTPFGFAGQYTDAETGLVYLRARYYDPATGQFISRDPLTDLTGSPYGYVYGNPVNMIDPSGLITLRGVLRGVAVVAGAVAVVAGPTPIGFGAVAVTMAASSGAAISDMRAHGGKCGADCQFDLLNVVLSGAGGLAVYLHPAARAVQAATALLYAGGLAASNTPPAGASTFTTPHPADC